jgi:hypothetical protein
VQRKRIFMLDIESLYEVEAGVLIEAEAPTQIGIIFNNAPYNPRYQIQF